MYFDNRLAGVAADDNPLAGKNISSGRGYMYGSHRKSSAAPDNPDPQLHFTGASIEYGKYLFNNVVLDDGDVLTYNHDGKQLRAVFQRRDRRGSKHVIQTAIFYRRSEQMNGLPVIDAIVTDPNTKHDHVFGSELKPTDILKGVVRGNINHLTKDDYLTAPSSYVNGEFCDSLNLTTATLSDANVIEDAYMLSESAAKAFGGWGYFVARMYLNPGECLLDTYGRVENGVYVPRFFPACGEVIRNDGLLIAKRKTDPLYGGVLMSAGALRNHDPYHDDCIYVDADPEHVTNPTDLTGSRVVDIRVIRNDADVASGRLKATDQNIEYLDEFALALKGYYRSIVDMYFSIKEEVIWGPEAYLLVIAALESELHEVAHAKQDHIRSEIKRLYRTGGVRRSDSESTMYSLASKPHVKREGAIIETYSIQIVVKYPIPVTVSSKLTDNGGAKGIVGKVVPDDEMYRDERGQIIHVVRSTNAVPRRSTYSSVYQIYWDAASRELRMKLNPMLAEGKLDEAWDLLMDYLALYNPEWPLALAAVHKTPEDKQKLFEEVNNIGVRIYLPHDLQDTPIDITERVRAKYPPYKSRLEFTNSKGERVWTKERIYVGTLPTLRLDKTGREFKSSASMRTNFIGVVSSGGGPGVNKPNSYPVKDEVIKYGGESERRLFKNYSGMLFDYLYDINNNPITHEEMVRGMFRSETPSNPGVLVDRNKYPLGHSIPVKMMNVLQACEGFKLVKPVREDN